jgi:hypothetical protein
MDGALTSGYAEAESQFLMQSLPGEQVHLHTCREIRQRSDSTHFRLRLG